MPVVFGTKRSRSQDYQVHKCIVLKKMNIVLDCTIREYTSLLIRIIITYLFICLRKENEVALQSAEMRDGRMYEVKVKDRVPSKEFRERD